MRYLKTTAFAPPQQFDLSGRSQMTVDQPQVQAASFGGGGQGGEETPSVGAAAIRAAADLIGAFLTRRAEQKKQKAAEAAAAAAAAAAASKNKPVEYQDAVYERPADNSNYIPDPMNSVA